MDALASQAQSDGGSSGGRISVVAAELIRMSLAALLLFSGLSKLRAPYEFLTSVYGYQMTGPFSSLMIATVLPWLEVVAAICLWGKICYRGALVTVAILGGVFSAAVAIAIGRQLDISCGCFIAADKIGYVTLLRSVSVLVAAIVGVVLATRKVKTIS
jgi:hypothetical protein